MHKHNYVGMATIASHEQLLVRDKNMAEKVLGLSLLLIYRSSISNIRKIGHEKRVYCVNVNKSHPRLVATLQQG